MVRTTEFDRGALQAMDGYCTPPKILRDQCHLKLLQKIPRKDRSTNTCSTRSLPLERKRQNTMSSIFKHQISEELDSRYVFINNISTQATSDEFMEFLRGKNCPGMLKLASFWPKNSRYLARVEFDSVVNAKFAVKQLNDVRFKFIPLRVKLDCKKREAEEKTVLVKSCKLAFCGKSESHLCIFADHGPFLWRKNSRRSHLIELQSNCVLDTYKLQIEYWKVNRVSLCTADNMIYLEVRHPPHILECGDNCEEWVLSTKHADLIKHATVYCLELDSSSFGDAISFLKQNGLKDNNDCHLNIENYDPCLLLEDELLGMRHLDQPILFTIQSLLSQYVLHKYNFDADFIRCLSQYSTEAVVNALQSMDEGERIYNPLVELMNQLNNSQTLPKPNIFSSMLIPRVHITPTSIVPLCALPEESNRVLRHYREYHDRFIRVSFLDDTYAQLYFNSSMENGVHQRIMDIFTKGFTIGNWKYEFLLYSSSQLRESSCWFFSSPGRELTCDDIRKELGEFDDIRNVAKYADRMGLCLSSTKETVSLSKGEWTRIDDITRNGYVFSDGIGIISSELADEINVVLGEKGHEISCYQCRFGGCKGVFAVDPRLKSHKLLVRPSMIKFKTQHATLEVIRVGRAMPCFLNRQIIILLKSLQLENSVFSTLQNEMIAELDSMLTDREVALKMLNVTKNQNIVFDTITKLIQAGVSLKEPFVNKFLRTLKQKILFDLKSKSRIHVKKGALLMGALDEYQVLEPDEVYIHTSKYGILDNRNVVVTKNPCLHPGDIKVLKAVARPELKHMKNCIVFPSVGHRPCPNQMSGSDLDGDIYFVSWDERLIPSVLYPPTDYDSTPAPTLETRVQVADLARFFIDYKKNDNLGKIANAHLVHADKLGADSPECLQLAALHSQAVDFVKTGQPVILPKEFRCDSYPDFMEKSHKDEYVSNSILGILYRDVAGKNDMQFTTNIDAGQYLSDMDPNFFVEGFENYVDKAKIICKRYWSDLIRKMRLFRVRDETELFVGVCRNGRRRRSYDTQRINQTIDSLISSYSQANQNLLNKLERQKMAYAWYCVAYHIAQEKQQKKMKRRRNKRKVQEYQLLSFGFILVHELNELLPRLKAREARVVPLFTDLKTKTNEYRTTYRQGFASIPKEEVREIASKRGKASGEARRARSENIL